MWHLVAGRGIASVGRSVPRTAPPLLDLQAGLEKRNAAGSGAWRHSQRGGRMSIDQARIAVTGPPVLPGTEPVVGISIEAEPGAIAGVAVSQTNVFASPP